MKVVASIALAFVLTVQLAGATGAVQEDERRRVTFRLVLKGDVPGSHDIGITVGYPGATKLVDKLLCGPKGQVRILL